MNLPDPPPPLPDYVPSKAVKVARARGMVAWAEDEYRAGRLSDTDLAIYRGILEDVKNG